jgi:hypothetical protein
MWPNRIITCESRISRGSGVITGNQRSCEDVLGISWGTLKIVSIFGVVATAVVLLLSPPPAISALVALLV